MKSETVPIHFLKWHSRFFVIQKFCHHGNVRENLLLSIFNDHEITRRPYCIMVQEHVYLSKAK